MDRPPGTRCCDSRSTARTTTPPGAWTSRNTWSRANSHNTRQVLLRSARDATGAKQTTLRAAAERHAELLGETADTFDINVLMGVEGTAARTYFQALPSMCSAARVPFERTRRPPTDPVNCLLSFAYGMLRVSVHGALDQVGLHPYIGYLHGVRPGKPALALDLMEEFRPLIADRFVMTFLNRRELRDSNFSYHPGDVVELKNREVPAALLPLVQARLLARHLRGDLAKYVPWTVT